MIKDYILQNWALVMVLSAFAMLLKITHYIEKRTVRRMYYLVISVFLLSIIVFFEFYFSKIGILNNVRTVLMAIRYSATPLIIAMILFTLGKRESWKVFIPALITAVINFISIFNGIVFSLDESGTLHRGALGYLPYIAVGYYSVILVINLIKQSNKQSVEIIPIAYLSLSFASGLILPFVLGKDYSQIFCTTMAVALFVYFDFLILQATRKDSLTGVLNRQAFDAAIEDDSKDISAIVAVDMNGLKAINDYQGHAAGDEALETLALCFMRSTKRRQLVYRTGGDEFVIICTKVSESEVKHLVERIQRNVASTKYTCAIGYSYAPAGKKDINEMLRESDEIMYANKAKFYETQGRKYR